MATKTSFPAKDIAKDVTELMQANPETYGKNVYWATNHVLKQWNIASLQQMDDKYKNKLNKALGYMLG